MDKYPRRFHSSISPRPISYGIAGLNIGIMHHRSIDSRPVQSWKMLHEGIGKHHLRIRPALRSTGEVAGPTIQEEVVMVLNVQQRLQDVGNSLWMEQRQQRSGRSKRIPDAVEIVIVRRRALPQRILASAVHRHQHRVVKTGGKLLTFTCRASFDLYGRELFVPRRNRQLCVCHRNRSRRPQSSRSSSPARSKRTIHPTFTITGFLTGSKCQIRSSAYDGRRGVAACSS